MELLGAVIVFFGSVFLFLGAVGLMRMPDVYNKIQAGTKATTLGAIMTLAGLGIYHPSWLLKLIVLIVFIMLTNPISSHALARASHYIRIPLAKGSVADKLEEDDIEKEAEANA